MAEDAAERSEVETSVVSGVDDEDAAAEEEAVVEGGGGGTPSPVTRADLECVEQAVKTTFNSLHIKDVEQKTHNEPQQTKQDLTQGKATDTCRNKQEDRTKEKTEKIIQTSTEDYRRRHRLSPLPRTKVAEPCGEGGGGVVGVVEARVAALAAPGQVLLQGQQAPLLVVAEAVPETNRMDDSANQNHRRCWSATGPRSIGNPSQP